MIVSIDDIAPDFFLKNLKLKVWNIGKEKDFLASYNGDTSDPNLYKRDIHNIAESLLDKEDYSKVKDLHYNDLLYVMFLVSLGANGGFIKEYNLKCKKCSILYEYKINIKNSIHYIPYSTKELVTADYGVLTLYDKDIDFKGKCVESSKIDIKSPLDLKLMDYLYLRYNLRNIMDYDCSIRGSTNCVSCGNKIDFIVDSNTIFLNNIIESNLKYYYDASLYLASKGNINISDFNNLYPFEVDIYLDKLNQQIKEENEAIEKTYNNQLM